MSSNPYDYENRQAILPISWNDMHGLCRALALAIAPYKPEVILPIGRGGFYPGTLIAHLLRVEVYPIRVTRRISDEVVNEEPRWLMRPPEVVKGRRVLLVDEISSTGETLALVHGELRAMGALEVRSAVLYAHSWGADTPDYIGLISDALILNPWDREIVQNGAIVPHPEYVGALVEQHIVMDASYLIDAPTYQPAKVTPR